MYTIVAGIDDDEARATAQARTILDMPTAADEFEVVLAHSFVENASGASIAQVASVTRAEDMLEAAGVDVILEESGNNDPADAVIEIAERRGADLVVVAGRKRSPTKKAVFGSVSQKIMLNTDRPVLVCGAAE